MYSPKKTLHEDEIRHGLAQLRELGVDPAASRPYLVSRLREHYGKSRSIDLAIAFTLGKIAESASVEALTELDRETADRDTKKEIRRSFFKLSQKGLAPPQSKPVGASPAASIFKATPDIEAYMSSVDGGGGRLIWIVRTQTGGGLQVLQAMVNDREGLQRAGGAVLKRKELRRMAEEIKAKHGVSMIAVPGEYADQILCESFEKAKSSGRSSGLEDFPRMRAVFNSGASRIVSHPIYQRLETEHAREGAWREQSRRLLDESEFKSWILDLELIEPFLSQLQEAQSSRLVLNPFQKEERRAAIVRDAVRALCSGETGKLMRRRMEDMALYLHETNRNELAKLALAVALQIGEDSPGPLDISFLTGLVQKSFVFYFSQEREKGEQEPSLIVKP